MSLVAIHINHKGDEISLSLHDLKQVRSFDSFEIATFLYPYNKNITADDFQVLPYEEYVNDISDDKRSLYKFTKSTSDKIFGIVIAFILSVIFMIIDINLLVSVEAVVSILGAYAVGKELWHDLDDALHEVTKRRKLKWLLYEMPYEKQSFGTMESLWDYARSQRNTQQRVLADRFEFILQSNSKYISLHYNKDTVNDSAEEETMQLLSFTCNAAINKDEYMLGCKVTLLKRFLIFHIQTEMFQVLEQGATGAIVDEEFIENTVLIRKTIRLGRLKWYRKKHCITGTMITRSY